MLQETIILLYERFTINTPTDLWNDIRIIVILITMALWYDHRLSARIELIIRIIIAFFTLQNKESKIFFSFKHIRHT